MANSIGKPRIECTPEITERICAALRRGMFKKDACKAGPISYSTFKEWQVMGREGIEPYATFSAATKKAETQSKAALLEKLEAHHDRHWQSIAWLLERRFHKQYGKKDSSVVTLKRDKRELVDVSDEELAALVKKAGGK